tara:strand:+ start:5815 stop:6402 length:588 start_codon:yes stop_codon:yes gene_type:complete
MATDERINQTEWNVKKVCPICEDIKNKVIDLEGEQMMGDDGNPLFCPECGHMDIRMHHTVNAVELGRTSDRGDAQPWTHQVIVRCESCSWSHVAMTNPCLGNPWDETIGLTRPLDQSDQQKHAIRWSNEQAVGLRDHDEKYDKKSKLKSKTYKSKRVLRIDEADRATDEKKLHYKPSENEKRARKRADLYKKKGD